MTNPLSSPVPLDPSGRAPEPVSETVANAVGAAMIVGGGHDSYHLGSRPIDHATCVEGSSGAWYPNFGNGIEIFGWAHHHVAAAAPTTEGD